MTNEEAIEIILTVRAYYASLTAGYPKGKDVIAFGEYMCSEVANACLMAVKALEEQKVGEWVPTSERLPDEKGTYTLVTIKIPKREPKVRSGFFYKGDFHNDNGDFWRATDKEVVAWMPLPEPYEADKEVEVNEGKFRN